MRTKVESSVKFNGLSVRIDKYIELWESYGGNNTKVLPFKQHTCYYNNASWSMQPLKCVACFTMRRECIGVFEIWERKDGIGMECYKFDDVNDYENYKVSDRNPSAIQILESFPNTNAQ